MPKTKRPRSIKILFIGNSFTARNNLPGMLAQMAAARGVRVEHELISMGGASLRTHWNAGRAAKAIETGRYDYVVLQEQSTLPVKNAQRMAENVRLFDEVIKRSGAKTVLYMTWARRHAPEAQQAITNAYNTIGAEIGAIVIPVGTVWQKFLEPVSKPSPLVGEGGPGAPGPGEGAEVSKLPVTKSDKPALHDRDQSHPTPAGTYLAACVFLAALFKQNPLGLDPGPPSLDRQDKALLQRAAWKELGSK